MLAGSTPSPQKLTHTTSLCIVPPDDSAEWRAVQATRLELRDGLRQLARTAPPPPPGSQQPHGAQHGARLEFSESELTSLLRYLDPNADGDLSFTEVKAGLARTHRPAQSSSGGRSPPRTPRTPRDAPPTTAPSIDILRLGIAPGSPPLTDLRSTAAALDRQLLAVGALSIES